ncbi:MAG: branched-chain amino acid ABC transporter permease [Candidatus Hydrogenedentota bacterium]
MSSRHQLFLYCIVLSVLFLFPYLPLVNNYILHIFILTLIYVVLALSLNVVIGFAGLLDLGFIAFYGIGAYTTAILITRGYSFWVTMILGIIISLIFRFIIGMTTLRLRGDYLAIVTLGFGEIVRIVLNNNPFLLTNGPLGISSIPAPQIAGFILSSRISSYYLILIICLITFYIVMRLEHSKISRMWEAVRENEDAASSCGINVFLMKISSYLLAAVFAPIAGSFFAQYQKFVSPESFNFFESITIVCIVVLGGMGSIPGVICGSFIIAIMNELLRDLAQYRMLAFGLILVCVMIFKPDGLIGFKRYTFEVKDRR